MTSGSFLVFEDSAILDGLAPTGGPAVGVDVILGGTASLARILVEGTEGFGIRAVEGALDMTETMVRATQTVWGGGGIGLTAYAAASVAASGCVFDGNSTIGVLVEDPSTVAVFEGTVVRDTKPNDDGNYGWGIQVGADARLTFDGGVVAGNMGRGLTVTGSETLAMLSGTILSEMKPDLEGEWGAGVFVMDGAEARASDCLVEGNSSIGFGVDGPGTAAKLLGTAIRDTAAADGESGPGLQVSGGASVQVADGLIEGNTGLGILVSDEATFLDLEDSVIRRTIPQADLFGAGLSAYGGASVMISGCGLMENAPTGLLAREGAQVSVSGSLFRDNLSRSLVVRDSTTEVAVDSSTIRGTLAWDDGTVPVAVQILEAAHGTFTGCVIEENIGLGVTAQSAGTVIQLYDSVVRSTTPPPGGLGGFGVAISSGADVHLSRCAVDRNTSAGIIAVGHPTTVELVDSVIRDSVSNGSGAFGRGVEIGEGASAIISRCLMARNIEAGIVGRDEATTVDIADSIFRDSLENRGGVWGVGVVAFAGGEVNLARSKVTRTQTAGVLAFDAGSQINLLGVGVFSTGHGGRGGGFQEQVYGDGLLVMQGAAADVLDSVIMGNSRVGIYYQDAGGGLVAGNIITGNQSFGLAVDPGTEAVVYLGQENHIFGNAMGIPRSQAMDITTTPTGLPLPKKPKALF